VIHKVIFTSNEKGGSDTKDEDQKNSFNRIKEAFMGPKDKGGKALVIELNEDQREVTKFEKLNHYFVMCKNDLDKYIILFGFKKLGLVQGKILIYAKDVQHAYRIKFFFNRFQMKAFVLAPEMAKQQILSIVHYYTIGQFDILIAINQEYPQPLPILKDVSFVFNFQMPDSFSQYRELSQNVDREEGAVINLVTPEEETKRKFLSVI
jgi:superfamily II DNA/RNA helicase